MKKFQKIIVTICFICAIVILNLHLNWLGNSDCNQKNQIQKSIYQNTSPTQELPIESALNHLVVTI